jgi:CRP/FNR family transcriptional regulator, cyclic AMP receptor protein
MGPEARRAVPLLYSWTVENYGPYLRQCDLFADLDEYQLSALYPGCLWMRLDANEMLFHEGSPGGSIYIVESGEIAIERMRFRGDEKEEVITLSLRRPYEVIGELTLFDDSRRTASARATMDKTSLLMIDGRYVVACMERSPKLSVKLLRIVIGKLTEAMSRQSDRQMAPIPVRLAKHLVELADQHGKDGANGSVIIEGVVTQADLAHRIGCSREVVNKTLRDFGDEVVSSTRGKIEITNVRRLKKIAERAY